MDVDTGAAKSLRPAPAPALGATQPPPEAEEAALHTERGMVAGSASTSTAVGGRPMRPLNRITPNGRTRNAERSKFDATACVRGLLMKT